MVIYNKILKHNFKIYIDITRYFIIAFDNAKVLFF